MKGPMRFPIAGLAVVVLAASAPQVRAGRPAPQSAQETPAAHHAAGMAAWKAGRVEEALAEFQSALRLDRNYLPSLVQMADLLSSYDRVFEAYAVLQHAVAIAPDSADVHALLGRCFLRMEKLKEAQAEMSRALELNSELAEPQFDLAEIESRQGRWADARRHIEAYLARSPGTLAALELRARICMDMTDYDAALAAYREVQKKDPARPGVPMQIARTLLASGRYAEAEAAYHAVLQQKPADREALRGLYESAYQRGAYDKAVEALRQLAKLEPQSCEPLLNLVRAYRMLNQLDRARQEAARCIALVPTHASAHYLLGRIWFSEGNLVRAEGELTQAVKSEPTSAEYLYWRGLVELRLRKSSVGLGDLEKSAQLGPDQAGVHYTLALEYARLKRPADARKQMAEFRRLKKREEWKLASGGERQAAMAHAPQPTGAVDAEHLQDWIGFANYLLQENKPRDALLILKEALEVAPKDAEALTLAAGAYTETGEIAKARAAYSQAEKSAPTGLLFLGRGTLYLRLGEDALAMADLRRASTMKLPDAKAALAHTELASLLNTQKQYQEAEAELRRAVGLDPNNSAPRTMLGWTLVKLGKPVQAAVECRQVLEQDSSDSSARLGLALALVEQKNYPEAKTEIDRAAAIEGESGRILLARGKQAAAQGRSALAVDYLRRAGSTDPSQAEVFFLLGSELMKIGKISEAAVAFEKATIVDPANAPSWLELGKIYLHARRAQAAVGYLRKSVSAAPDNPEANYQLAVALAETSQFAEAKQVARHAKALGYPAAEALLESLAAQTSP